MASDRILGDIRLPVVPLDSKEGRALLQRRIALFARTSTLVSLGFFVLGNVMARLLDPSGGREMAANKAHWLHLAAICASVAVWLIARRAQRSSRQLFWLDLLGTLGPMVFYAAMAAFAFEAEPDRYDMLLLLIGLTVTGMRATIVPSTPRHTALITALATSPAIGLAYIVAHASPNPGAVYAAPISAGMWCVAATLTSTLASRVIFGLRARARDAERLGQYVLEGKIGEGGMGSVYRARHALMRRPTAIKLLPRDKAGEHAISRFEREVQHTSRLTHPNTVAIYDYGRTPDGVFYYAMEYLDGLDLQKLVDRFGPQPPERVVHVMRQVCGALAEAHEHGVVHRDVKPANVILCERGGIPDVAKVLDFGLAKDISASGDTKLSNVNSIIGTPLYMSPEAITSPASVDDRADLYALGAVGYFLLAGVPVFSGKTLVDICSQHLHQTPVPPSVKLGKELPPDLEKLILACLAKKRDDRPPTARALQEELARCAVEPWTEERARAWWQENAGRVLPSVAPDSFESGRTVVAIDLASRAAE